MYLLLYSSAKKHIFTYQDVLEEVPPTAPVDQTLAWDKINVYEMLQSNTFSILRLYSTMPITRTTVQNVHVNLWSHWNPNHVCRVLEGEDKEEPDIDKTTKEWYRCLFPRQVLVVVIEKMIVFQKERKECVVGSGIFQLSRYLITISANAGCIDLGFIVGHSIRARVSFTRGSAAGCARRQNTLACWQRHVSVK